ncbi:MAG: aminopeptidase N [Desulfuromonadales bacterium]|nr:aminopeptidase N [Desulfuromonadales bacterium]
MNEQPTTIRLRDYRPPAYLVETIDLHFDLAEEQTRVTARQSLRRHPQAVGAPALELHGCQLQLQMLRLDGRVLTAADYRIEGEILTILQVPEQFSLEVETLIHPAANTALEGLYLSNDIFCTQCEAEGFRRITFFPDRPDVLARFTTTLVADREKYPVLLANGNRVDGGLLEGGRHFARWDDPFPKPAYLFALVAGNLVKVEDTFVTRSGRKVVLQIWIEERNRDKCDHAMRSLQKAMRWDEETFGLEYDLDIYMIVAVDHFNMGAMENKGLNIFNSKYVLASPQTATDADFQAIEEVIGHEYFHNWTGNRVTCRDWFQLSLKEGLTVFRDQEFAADMTSRAVKRIEDVRLLRNAQFPEDAGPMAHPVRPDAYVEINNFYTSTVYNKGAEVIRMYQTLLGRDGFRRGLVLYLQRHDGQAVTVEDFLAAMAEANGTDLGQFMRWYTQAGTPLVKVTRQWDAATGTLTLTCTQSTPPTPGQPSKEPFHLPLTVGLLANDGRDLPLQLAGEDATAGPTRVLELRQAAESFRFTGLPAGCVPSVLRSFSAPVRLETDLSEEETAFLFAHDSDSFNRWEAGQQLATRMLLRLIAEQRSGRPIVIDPTFLQAFRRALGDPAADPALLSLALSLPTEIYLAEQLTEVDPEAIHQVREAIRHQLAEALRPEFLRGYGAGTETTPYSPEPAAVGRRSLKNLCLAYLMTLGDEQARALCLTQYRQGNNMTDVLAALSCLAQTDLAERPEVLADFYSRWQTEPLVVDKWFTLQATSRRSQTLVEVEELTRHPAFSRKNPNRVRALVGAFAQANPARFHTSDGAGYRFLADQVLALDPLNPQVAARLVSPLSRWRRLEAGRQAMMQKELQRIAAAPGLSRDVYEIVSKSLA